MTVVTINEDYHGYIGLAADYNCAIDFLIQKGWLHNGTEVWINHHGFLLKEIFDDWEKEIKNWNLEKFNTFFYDSFNLEEIEVYGS